MEQKPPEFSMRLFAINYYLSKPEPGLDQTYSDFRIFEVKQVPILRIFGTTSQGSNVLPYFSHIFHNLTCHIISHHYQLYIKKAKKLVCMFTMSIHTY